MSDPRTEAAANNAGWCDVVVRALGGETSWLPDHWTTCRRSPDGYPDAVTLSSGAEHAALLARVEGGPGCSVKDSFADLDLAPSGFMVMFEATWIRHRAPAPDAAPALEWRQVRSPADLLAWSAGHDLDVFVPALLDEQDVDFFHVPRTGAGFALFRTASVLGISNAIPGDADPHVVWSDLTTIAGLSCPGLDLVGYERGTDLAAAASAGFTTTGPLRVWMSC
jgi:hypothetical protein